MQQMIEQCSQMMSTMMNGGMMGGMMDGMMLPMLIGPLLFIALIAVGVMLLVRLMRNRTNGTSQTPHTILAERFARGEIGLEEYQERRSVLLSN